MSLPAAAADTHRVMKPQIDFLLHELLSNGRVTGRNCGADLQLGTLFTGLYRRDYPVIQSSEEILVTEPVFVCSVSLRLDEIEMYRRSMDSLASGLTGALGLSGSGFASVSELLSTAPDRTFYSLCSGTDYPPQNRSAEPGC